MKMPSLIQNQEYRSFQLMIRLLLIWVKVGTLVKLEISKLIAISAKPMLNCKALLIYSIQRSLMVMRLEIMSNTMISLISCKPQLDWYLLILTTHWPQSMISISPISNINAIKPLFLKTKWLFTHCVMMELNSLFMPPDAFPSLAALHWVKNSNSE